MLSALDLIGRLAGDGAVVLGFEDLHWACTATWDLFEFLARSLVDERVVLFGTFRPDEIAREPTQRRRLAELTRLPAARRLPMGGLTGSEVAEHVAALVEEMCVAAECDSRAGSTSSTTASPAT